MIRVRNRRRDAPPDGAVDGQIDAGLDAIREQFHVPGAFPADVVHAAAAGRRRRRPGADRAARRRPGADRVDRTAWEFRTLDPASSTDLDQAFFIDTGVRRSLTPTSCCTTRSPTSGSSSTTVTRSTPRRGSAAPRSTCPTAAPRSIRRHCARARRACCPTARGRRWCSRCASTGDGSVRLDGVERAVVRSRAKLAYDDVDAGRHPRLRRARPPHRGRRGSSRRATRSSSPSRSSQRTDDGWELRFEPRLESEDQNAGMSLATNLAVADTLLAAHTGLFRVMADVPERELRRLRHTARAFDLEWPPDMPLAALPALAPAGRPAHGGVPARRATLGRRRRSYAAVRAGRAAVARGDGRHVRPRHRAAAPPRRPLRDRGGARRRQRPAGTGERRAGVRRAARGDGEGGATGNQVDRAVLDLAEAVLLARPRSVRCSTA